MAAPLSMANIRDVAAASASRQRQAAAAKADEVKFINISDAALASTPNLLGLFHDVTNAVEDFRAAFEIVARKANLVPAGHAVIFTKTKFGWSIVIGPARTPKSSPYTFGDAE
jgi:hypothetical protein